MYQFLSLIGRRRTVVGLSALLMVLGGVNLWHASKNGTQTVAIPSTSQLQGSTEDAETSRQRRLSIPVAQRPDPRQIASFSILRTRPERVPTKLIFPLERFPTALRRRIISNPAHGMNWDLGQRLAGAPGRGLWLVPAKNYLCLLWLPFRGTPRQTCAPNGIAITYGLAIVILSAHPRHLPQSGSRFMVGVAPGRANRVLVRTGKLVRVRPVGESGLFTLRDSATSPPDRLTFK